LTFKPRGWRGKDAFEISGYVLDASGSVTYDIAGRWNSQLVARRAGDGPGALLPDINVNGPASPSTKEYILLWRNTVKPQAPFNLTPFAVTLNDCPDKTLKPYLPFTDCRLRPDQRAFEQGRYDRANELKSMQEEFQRAVRRKREEGKLPEHKPRWFEARTDRDTGERVWSPLRNGEQLQYWDEREKVFYSLEKDNWPGVERIFIDEEP
jgi:oxysterol-binding protein 1